jgi:class 3 adenylate cyclase/ABC-type uncharacterized transport system substrate-binding protein
MADQGVERKLAAILAADVAGYSRLVGLDEEGTLARLRALRQDIIDPQIAAHRGRIVKTTGDGLLVEFVSVVDAVRCALSMQRAVAEQENTVADDRRIQFRTGINQGDIVVDGDDILGDGVNVAARLEGIAEPGGICISARVHEDVTGRVDADFVDAGEQWLKNIDRPLRVYNIRVAPPSGSRPRTDGQSGTATAQALRRIGVLGVAPRPIYDELKRALAAYGHIDGRTIEVVYRWCDGDYDRYPALLQELIELPVDLIIALASPAAIAAKQATSTIPIVVVEIGHPVAYGIVPSLLRPGGNITGMSNGLHEFAPRSLRLFKEIVPEAARVAFLAPDNNLVAVARAWSESMEAVAHALDLTPRIYFANTGEECQRVINMMDRRTDVIVPAPDQSMLLNRAFIISAATALKIPVICQQPEFVLDGALLSLDPDRREVYRRVAYYVDAILKGVKPSELPIEEPSKSWLVLNLNTAKALGIEIPTPILMRADQVIE